MGKAHKGGYQSNYVLTDRNGEVLEPSETRKNFYDEVC